MQRNARGENKQETGSERFNHITDRTAPVHSLIMQHNDCDT